MMLTLPNGEKLRSQSQRRYILVLRNSPGSAPFIAKRSDNKKTIFNHYAASHQVCEAMVFDNATGEMLAQ